MVLPTLAMLALLLVPFLRPRPVMRVTAGRRRLRRLALAAIGWTGLTVAAIVDHSKEALTAEVDYSAPTDWPQLSPEEYGGHRLLPQGELRLRCHTEGRGQAGKIGPDLASRDIRDDAAWMIAHFKRPSAMVPGTSMPPIR